MAQNQPNLKHSWTPAAEELPNTTRPVLVQADHGRCYVAFITSTKTWFVPRPAKQPGLPMRFDKLKGVICWRECPDTPERETE